jgi:hypothetical protein
VDDPIDDGNKKTVPMLPIDMRRIAGRTAVAREVIMV